MISMIINAFRFLKYFYIGLRQDSEFRTLFILLLFLILGSTTFYHGIEKWSIIDSLYFSVMTMSTIGYGDFIPTTPFSKIFTILYTFLSIGAFATITAKIVTIVLKDIKKFHITNLGRKKKDDQ